MKNRKNILVIAKYNQPEALRVAVGLTLLDDAVKVDVLEGLADTPQVAAQMEMLEFADIPIDVLKQNPPAKDATQLARHIINSDVVFVV